jgi:hypothetical protein
MRSQFIQVPADAIAYKYSDPTDGARWLSDDSEVDQISKEDPSLITDLMSGAKSEARWAAKIVQVEGGYMAFESVADYETWTKKA